MATEDKEPETKTCIMAQMTPRHRPEGVGSVHVYIGEDSEMLGIDFAAEGCDVLMWVDAANARKLLTELQREVPELEEILADNKTFVDDMVDDVKPEETKDA